MSSKQYQVLHAIYMENVTDHVTFACAPVRTPIAGRLLSVQFMLKLVI